MKSYNVIHTLLILGLFVSTKIEVTTNWSDQFIEIQSGPEVILSALQTQIAILEVTTFDEYHIMANRGDNDNFQFTRIEVVEEIEGIRIGSPQFPLPGEEILKSRY